MLAFKFIFLLTVVVVGILALLWLVITFGVKVKNHLDENRAANLRIKQEADQAAANLRAAVEEASSKKL